MSLLFLGVLFVNAPYPLEMTFTDMHLPPRFIWCAANITLSRLILNSRQLASDAAEDKDYSVSFQQASRQTSTDTIIHLGYELKPGK